MCSIGKSVLPMCQQACKFLYTSKGEHWLDIPLITYTTFVLFLFSGCKYCKCFITDTCTGTWSKTYFINNEKH